MNITALAGSVAPITGASSGTGDATARELAEHGASVGDREQAKGAVQAAVDGFGRLDILIDNAGLMLLDSVVGAEVGEWERMIAVDQHGLLYVTHAVLPHLLAAAQDELRGVADIVNISSIAGRQAGVNFGVYNMTKFGVNVFTEALRRPPAVTAPIVGPKTLEQLEQNRTASDLILNEDDIARLNDVSAPSPNDYPYGPFGVKQRDRYVNSSDQAITELF